jgi:peptidoglycan hydrolase-like protein with peptidoglycan-binding domain
MRISNKQIKRIIQEEIRSVLNEQDPIAGFTYDMGPSEIVKYCKTNPGAQVPSRPHLTCASDGSGNYSKPGQGAPTSGPEIFKYCKAYPGKPLPGKGANIRCASDGSGHYVKVKPKKKYKYSANVENMQKVMVGHPEIGPKLQKIMGRIDGKLGPGTQRAVNYLRRYFKRKGIAVPRGVNSVLGFLASDEAAAGKNPAARELGLRTKAGDVAGKLEALVDKYNKTDPKNLKTLFPRVSKKNLQRIKDIAVKKGYKTVALVADAFLA